MGRKGMTYKTNFAKQKLIVDAAFANGFNWTRAYMEIYDVENPDLARRAVYRVKNNENVKKYIQFKEDELKLKYNISKEKIVKEVVDLIYDCKSDSATDRNNIIKGLDMLNKMMGFYSAEKHEHDLNGGIVINYLKPEDKNKKDGDNIQE